MHRIKPDLRIGDYLVIALVLLLAGTLQVFLARSIRPGETAVVSVKGEEIHRLSLSQVQNIPFAGAIDTVRVLTDGTHIWLKDSPCPYKICEKMGKISRAGEMIVCVPNQIVVRILPQNTDDLDATTM